MSCWLIPQKELWNHASFFYPKLLLLLLEVGEEGAVIPIVLKIYIWRLVRSSEELNIHQHSSYLAVLVWSRVPRFSQGPLILLPTFHPFSLAHRLNAYSFFYYVCSPAFPWTLSGNENNWSIQTRRCLFKALPLCLNTLVLSSSLGAQNYALCIGFILNKNLWFYLTCKEVLIWEGLFL